MFFDGRLMSSRYLGKVWRVANNIEDSSDEDINMPNICNCLDKWVDSHHEGARKRLSLRTSSVLVSGAARLYKRKIHQLYEDFLQLDNDVTFRKRIRYSTDSFNVSDVSPTFTEDSEDIATPYDSLSEEDKNSELDKFVYNPRLEQNDNDNNDSDCASSNNCVEPQATESQHPLPRQDKSIQVSPTIQRGFDETLPFGYIVIHDSYKDRIPSRIIFSSLNVDVKKLD